jgi:hypothetical protein
LEALTDTSADSTQNPSAQNPSAQNPVAQKDIYAAPIGVAEPSPVKVTSLIF